MGIYSRDYVRESTGRHYGWGDDTPACKCLIIITGVVFLLQLVVTHRVHGGADSRSYMDDWFALDLDGVLHGQIWRFVTYAFLHDRDWPLHIVLNMLGLWWFGPDMERIYGTREFTCFYLVSAAAAGAGFVVWQLAMGLTAGAVGASGAVLAVLTLFAMHYPGLKINIYGIFPIEIRWLLALYVALDLFPVLMELNGEGSGSGVAHMAHLIGMLFGWLYRHYEWHLSSWLDLSAIQNLPRRWRQTRAKKKLRVFDPEPEPAAGLDLESELDRILAKIHEHGSGSLTEREQSILTRASQQYKDRR